MEEFWGMEPQRQLLHGSYRQIPRFRAYHEHTDPHGKRRDWKWTAITLKPPATASYTFFSFFFFSKPGSSLTFRGPLRISALTGRCLRSPQRTFVRARFSKFHLNSLARWILREVSLWPKKNNFFRKIWYHHILIKTINFPRVELIVNQLFLLKCSLLS